VALKASTTRPRWRIRAIIAAAAAVLPASMQVRQKRPRNRARLERGSKFRGRKPTVLHAMRSPR